DQIGEAVAVDVSRRCNGGAAFVTGRRAAQLEAGAAVEANKIDVCRKCHVVRPAVEDQPLQTGQAYAAWLFPGGTSIRMAPTNASARSDPRRTIARGGLSFQNSPESMCMLAYHACVSCLRIMLGLVRYAPARV